MKKSQDAAHAGVCLQDGGDAPTVPAAGAMTDGSAEVHHNSITRIFPRLGETATTEEVLEQIGEFTQAT